MSLNKSFFAEPVEQVARNLPGCQIEKDDMRARIVETEAYLEDDPASHAYPRKTERNSLMYETHGHIYVYICYGIHHMLNFTADEKGVGGILVRALEPLDGIERMKENRGVEQEKELCNGPGKICEALNIDKELNGTEVGDEIKLSRGNAPEVEVDKRIGISKAVDRELRFFIPENQYVSTR